jgi:hypothetical protein
LISWTAPRDSSIAVHQYDIGRFRCDIGAAFHDNADIGQTQGK